MAINEQWTRVILLLPPALSGRGVPDALQAQFAARDWFAIPVNDPYLALAELGLREKAQIARRAWGLQRLEQIGLVVLEPRQWEIAGVSLPDLTHAVGRYIPAASIWYASGGELMPVYQPSPAIAGQPPRERPEAAHQPAARAGSENFESPHVAAHDHQPRVATVTGANGLRIASAPAASISNGESLDGDDGMLHARLSREEIEMLLDPIESPRGEVAS